MYQTAFLSNSDFLEFRLNAKDNRKLRWFAREKLDREKLDGTLLHHCTQPSTMKEVTGSCEKKRTNTS